MSQFDWPNSKKIETMEADQNRRSYGKIKCLPIWLTSIGEKGRTLGITYMGLKRGAIRNTLGEHIGNLANILGI
jgi:hypothetical protein